MVAVLAIAQSTCVPFFHVILVCIVDLYQLARLGIARTVLQAKAPTSTASGYTSTLACPLNLTAQIYGRLLVLMVKVVWIGCEM